MGIHNARGHRAVVLIMLGLSCCIPRLGASFVEEFGPGWDGRWSHSKDAVYEGRFIVEDGEDPALKLPKESARYAFTAALDTPIDPSEGIILQYEAKWSLGHTCGGGYLKFFTHDPEFKPEDMDANTPYTVMFGPDKCGATNKVHLILRHKSPLDGEIEEKHLSSPPKVPGDPHTHLYTAVFHANNTLQLLVDGIEAKTGSIFGIFDPSINPPEEIPDPSDIKPKDWVDEAKIPDPSATKPDDWVDDPLMVDEEAEKPSGWLDDEPAEITDPDATMPEEWDEEEDGEWVAPQIANPKCVAAPGCGKWEKPMIPNPDFKGAWSAPMIDNPEYKGPWVQKTMPNPKHFKDENPLANIGKIGAVGFEIWTMDKDIIFDNLVITDNLELANEYKEKWQAKFVAEEAKAKQEAEERKQQFSKRSIADYLQEVVEIPGLEPFEAYLQPIVDFARESESMFIGAAAVLVLLTIFTLTRCCRGGSKRKDVGRAKKEDQSEPDDAAEGPSKDESEKTGTEEIEEEEEEDEDEGKPRQRAGKRRAD